MLKKMITLYLLSVVILIVDDVDVCVVVLFYRSFVFISLLLMNIGLFTHDGENSLRREIRIGLIYCEMNGFVCVFFCCSFSYQMLWIHKIKDKRLVHFSVQLLLLLLFYLWWSFFLLYYTLFLLKIPPLSRIEYQRYEEDNQNKKKRLMNKKWTFLLVFRIFYKKKSYAWALDLFLLCLYFFFFLEVIWGN